MATDTLPLDDGAGWRLLALDRTDEEQVDAGAPCPLALVVVRRTDGRVLLGRNRWRDRWELPGGVRDADESAHHAARRELREETGLDLDVSWVGLATFEEVVPARREGGAVYLATAGPAAHAHPADHELTGVTWADVDAPPHDTALLDLAVARWALRSGTAAPS